MIHGRRGLGGGHRACACARARACGSGSLARRPTDQGGLNTTKWIADIQGLSWPSTADSARRSRLARALAAPLPTDATLAASWSRSGATRTRPSTARGRLESQPHRAHNERRESAQRVVLASRDTRQSGHMAGRA